MKKVVYIVQLVISILGFLIYSFFSGIVGSYAIEYKENPTIMDKTLYAFDSSSYPFIACAFLIWTGIVIVILFKKRCYATGCKSDR